MVKLSARVNPHIIFTMTFKAIYNNRKTKIGLEIEYLLLCGSMECLNEFKIFHIEPVAVVCF